MKSAGDGGVVQSCLQVLHVHVFLAAPLGDRRVAEPGADQHQGRVPARERPHHAGPAADLTVQPLDQVVATDARPVLAGKSAVGQRFLCTILGHSLLSPFRMVCGNFILPELACYVFFYAIFNLRNLLYIKVYLIKWLEEETLCAKLSPGAKLSCMHSHGGSSCYIC